MAQKSIFIASASESKSLATKIGQGLADAGYRPLRWWQEFPAGSLTLDRLIEIAETADGAVFLLTAEDRTWYRQELSQSPRDNVILEYGMFVARNGRQRTLMVTAPETRLPSDVAGITSERIVDDFQSVVERTIEHFEREFSNSLPPQLQAIRLTADPIVVGQQMMISRPASWHQRDLYFGLEGAMGWLAAVGEKSYAPRTRELQLQRLQLTALETVSVRTFVSFGPGDAETDKEIAIGLRNRERWLHYIPVDISDGLLHCAFKLLSDQVRVPIGILSDFEDRLNFIAFQLRDHAVRPILFALLGNTLGNLDRYERRFLRTLEDTVMQVGDYLLIDVSLAGSGWSRDQDPRCQYKSYGPGDRRFIATGISRRSDQSIESIVRQFETRIKFRDGGSDIDETQSIDVYDAKINRVVLTIRRYDWPSLLDWLKKNLKTFQIVFNEALPGDILGDGVVLLRKIKK